ncbi:hypothetical protein AAC387_Pa01g0689 [Persea americana]
MHVSRDATFSRSNWLLKVPEPETPTPAHIASNQIFYPFFKDCIGVIDGTYVPSWVPIKDHQRSANDKKALSDVLQNKGIHNKQVPEGKYFLVDAGYAHKRVSSWTWSSRLWTRIWALPIAILIWLIRAFVGAAG